MPFRLGEDRDTTQCHGARREGRRQSAGKEICKIMSETSRSDGFTCTTDLERVHTELISDQLGVRSALSLQIKNS